MRVLLVAPQPFYKERGTPIAVRLLAETLCAAGYEVDLLVYHEGDDLLVPRLKLYRTPSLPGLGDIPVGISVKKLICDVLLCIRFAQLWLGRRYDIVHAVEESIFPAVFFNLFARKPLVCDMDSLLSQQLVQKWRFMKPLAALLGVLERAAIRRSDRVLAVCEELAVHARACLPGDRVTVLPDVPLPDRSGGLAVESLRSIVPDGCVLALYVGNLEHYQGVGLLLEALQRSDAQMPLRVLIIGGEPLHIEAHRDRAEQLGIADRVLFLGPRPVDALPRYLAQADILISPRTLGQNTPMKIYSYMQAAKAILATRIGSHLQVLDDACALLVQPDAGSLADGLQRIVADANLRTALGAAALRKVETQYSLAAFQEKLLAVYAGLRPAPVKLCSET